MEDETQMVSRPEDPWAPAPAPAPAPDPGDAYNQEVAARAPYTHPTSTEITSTCSANSVLGAIGMALPIPGVGMLGETAAKGVEIAKMTGEVAHSAYESVAGGEGCEYDYRPAPAIPGPVSQEANYSPADPNQMPQQVESPYVCE